MIDQEDLNEIEDCVESVMTSKVGIFNPKYENIYQKTKKESSRKKPNNLHRVKESIPFEVKTPEAADTLYFRPF